MVFLLRIVTYDSGISPSAVVEKTAATSFVRWKLYRRRSIPGFKVNTNYNSGNDSLDANCR